MFIALMIIAVSFIGTGYVRAATSPSPIPIKAAMIYDGSNTNTNQSSDLYTNVVRVLNTNKIPYVALDISSGNIATLVDGNGNLAYSVAIIMADGTAINGTNSQNIVNAVNAGMGAVATLPTTANAALSAIFGISVLGTQQTTSAYFTVNKDIFTFSYAGTTIYQSSTFQNHTLLSGTNIEANFPSVFSSEPAIWTYSYGSGTTVYHNTTATNTMAYWGIMLQSILYAMPIGVSSPDNVMALDVDDCPTSYYSPDSLQENYYDFMGNYLTWLNDYNGRSTFFTAFSYSGNASSFWDDPQGLQAAADIVESGNELGLHCGDLHLPLDAEYWGSTANVNAQVATMNQAMQILKQGLLTQYGINLGNITSYVAPGNGITGESYQALQSTTIKYVGAAFSVTGQSGSGTSSPMVKGAASQQSTGSAATIADALKTYDQSTGNSSEAQVISQITAAKNKNPMMPSIQTAVVPGTANAPAQYTLTVNLMSGSTAVTAATITENPNQSTYDAGTKVQLTATMAAGWIFIDWSGSNDLSSTTTNPTTITMNGNENITLIVTYPQTFEDFGYQGNTGIYNLPRIESGISIYGQPNNPTYPYEMENLLTSFESGQPYIAFIHPDQQDLDNIPGETLSDVFNALSIWGNYIATNYPFYRWMTSTQIGDYLSSRTGVLSAQWSPGTNSLQITTAQPDDTVHIKCKSNQYIQTISTSGSTMTVTITGTPNNFQSSQYTVVRVSNDYFIYPLGQKSLMPVKPATPFVYQNVTEPDSTPVLNGIGNQQAVVGQPLSFTISGADANNNPLTYSASNLPSGASFSSSTRTFTWTPSTPGAYPGISFAVSDGATSSNEIISITVSATSPSTAEIIPAVTSGTDDGFTDDSGIYSDFLWTELGNAGASENDWFRFTGVTIPKGATIVHAYLKTAQAGWTPGAILKITGNDTASPSAPTSALSQIALSRTTAAVDWTVGYSDNAYHNSPDIAAVIQELVNKNDYSGGGVIQLLVDNNGSAIGAQAIVKTYESGSPPELDIVYTAGTLSHAAEINTYSLPGQTGSAVINSAAGTIGVTVPAGTNVTALAATFTASAGVSSVKVGSVSQVSGTTTNNFTNPVTYVVTAQDGVTTKNWVVTATTAASNAAEITAYSLPGQTGSAVINSAAGTIGVTVPAGTNVTAMAATFTVSAGVSSVKVGSVSQVSGTTTNNFTNPVTYVVTAQDGVTTKNWVVTVTTAASNAAEITAYSLPGQTGSAVINSAAGTIGVTVPAGTNVTAMAATFTVSAGVSSVKVGSVSQVSGTTANNFTNPVTYVVTAQDGVTTKNWVVTVTIQSGTTEILKSVATGTDDGFSGSWGYYNNLGWIQAGNPGSPYNAWFRFTGITIPKGATIVHAYLETEDASWTTGTNLKISAEKAASPAAPTGTADQTARVRTTANVTWNSGYSDSAYHNSPDIAAVIQELVNGYDYSAGGVMQLLVDNNGSTGSAQAILMSLESGNAPKLDIIYTAGTLSHAAEINTYSLPGQTGSAVINSAAGTIGVTVPAGTNVTAMAATFTVSAGVSSVKVGSVSQVSGTTTNNFTNPVTYVVTAQDGVTTKNWVVTATTAASNAAEITAYSLPGQTGSAVINSAAGTIGVTVPAGTNVTAMAATFTVSAGVSSVKVGSVSQVSGTTTNNFTNPVTYVVTAQDGVTTKNWVVTVTTAASNAAEITAYSLPGQTGSAVINSAAGTIGVTVPAGTNVTAMAATFTVSAGVSSVKVGSVSQVSGTTANNFTNPVTYVVTAQDGVTTKNWVVTVTIQSGTTEILKSVATGTDDGFSGSWGYYNNLGWIQAGNPGSPYNAWFRFTGITIPKGATIVHAYLETEDASWTTGTNLKISAEKAASPAAPTGTADQTARVRTTANVTWNSGYSDSAYHNSPDIAAVIQELVNGYDYSAGGVMQLLVDNNGSTGSAQAILMSLESGNAPKLDIIYTAGTLSHAAEINTYSLPGQTGSAVINSAAGTIGVTVPAGTNVTAMAATFTVSAGVSSVKVGSVSQVSGTTTNNFTNPVTYVVTAQDGVTTKNWVVTVTTAASNAAEITAYSLPGQTGSAVINSAAGTIGLTLPAGTNVTAMAATFTVSAGVSSVKVGSVSQVSGTTANNFTNPVTYVVTAQDGVTTKNWVVTVTTAASNAAEITAYSLPGQTGSAVINSAAGTIGVTVPAGTNVTAMAATFTVSAGVSSVKVGSVSQVSGTTANNFTNPVTYVVTAQDGVTTKNWVVTVTIQSGTTEILKSVATGTDDGFSGSWGYYNNLGWIQAGNPGSPYNAWFRFTGITIPKGATIVHAYLETEDASWTTGTNLKISAEKAASPAAPTGTADQTAG